MDVDERQIFFGPLPGPLRVKEAVLCGTALVFPIPASVFGPGSMTYADVQNNPSNIALIRLVTYALECTLKCYNSAFPPLGVAITSVFLDEDLAARQEDPYAFVKGPCDMAVSILLDEKGCGEFMRSWMTLATPAEQESPWKRRRQLEPHKLSYKHVDSGIKLAALIGAVTDKNVSEQDALRQLVQQDDNGLYSLISQHDNNPSIVGFFRPENWQHHEQFFEISPNYRVNLRASDRGLHDTLFFADKNQLVTFLGASGDTLLNITLPWILPERFFVKAQVINTLKVRGTPADQIEKLEESDVDLMKAIRDNIRNGETGIDPQQCVADPFLLKIKVSDQRKAYETTGIDSVIAEIYPGLSRIYSANNALRASFSGNLVGFYRQIMREAISTVSGCPTGNLPESLHTAWSTYQQRKHALRELKPDFLEDVESIFVAPEADSCSTLSWFLQNMVAIADEYIGLIPLQIGPFILGYAAALYSTYNHDSSSLNILFYGPPATGKSKILKTICTMSGVNYVSSTFHSAKAKVHGGGNGDCKCKFSDECNYTSLDDKARDTEKEILEGQTTTAEVVISDPKTNRFMTQRISTIERGPNMKATNDLPKDGDAFVSRFCAIYIPGDTSKNKMQGKDKITHKATMAVDKKSLQIVTTAFRFLGAMSVVTGLPGHFFKTEKADTTIMEIFVHGFREVGICMTVRDINRVTEVAICLTNLALLVQLKTSDLSDTDKALACMANLVVTPEACLLAYHLTHDVSDRVWQKPVERLLFSGQLFQLKYHDKVAGMPAEIKEVVKNPNNDYILLNGGKSWTSVARAICNELDCDVDARNPGPDAIKNYLQNMERNPDGTTAVSECSVTNEDTRHSTNSLQVSVQRVMQFTDPMMARMLKYATQIWLSQETKFYSEAGNPALSMVRLTLNKEAELEEEIQRLTPHDGNWLLHPHLILEYGTEAQRQEVKKILTTNDGSIIGVTLYKKLLAALEIKPNEVFRVETFSLSVYEELPESDFELTNSDVHPHKPGRRILRSSFQAGIVFQRKDSLPVDTLFSPEMTLKAQQFYRCTKPRMQTLPLAITSVGDDAFVTIQQDDECGEYTMKNPEFKEARAFTLRNRERQKQESTTVRSRLFPSGNQSPRLMFDEKADVYAQLVAERREKLGLTDPRFDLLG